MDNAFTIFFACAPLTSFPGLGTDVMILDRGGFLSASKCLGGGFVTLKELSLFRQGSACGISTERQNPMRGTVNLATA
jgi:hypothetical protein